jgi:hypothetical protein
MINNKNLIYSVIKSNYNLKNLKPVQAMKLRKKIFDNHQVFLNIAREKKPLKRISKNGILKYDYRYKLII